MAAVFLCRGRAVCGGSAAVELELGGIFLSFPCAVLRNFFQMEIFMVERLVLGAGLGVVQLSVSAGDRMVRSLSARPCNGIVAGVVGGTAAGIERISALSGGFSAMELPGKGGISQNKTAVVPGIVFCVERGNALYADRMEPFAPVCLE